jgi:Fe-S cluster assembly protein SufD
MLIIMEENSSASLLLCDHSSSSQQTLSTSVTEIFMAKGASLDLYELEETSPGNTRLGNLYVYQDSDSRFNHSNITLTNGFTRNYMNVALEGRGAEANVNGLAIGDKSQHIDNRTLIDHKTGNCTSNELYKYILDEQSTGVFAGKMLIRPDAQQTVSLQTNRNLCLTNDAHMYAQPQLEIYADDVKCSHGSTVGQLDENALFYMRQRGIPADEARHLLMYAFAGEVIDNIKIEALRDRLHMLVEKRLRGDLNHCKGCSLCK